MRYLIILFCICCVLYFIKTCITYFAYKQRFPKASWWTFFFPIVVLLLTCSLSSACDFGRTYKDFYGKPDSYDLAVASDGGAYYFPEGDILHAKNTVWKRVFFKDGKIFIKTKYELNWYRTLSKENLPYVVYRGHRWYPQHHGIIYVYQDGREVN